MNPMFDEDLLEALTTYSNGVETNASGNGNNDNNIASDDTAAVSGVNIAVSTLEFDVNANTTTANEEIEQPDDVIKS